VDPEVAAKPDAANSGDVADGLSRMLDPRWVDLERQTGWIATMVATTIGVVAATLLVVVYDPPRLATALLLTMMAVALVLFAWWQQRWPGIAYRHASYRVDTDGLEIQRGVYFRSVTTVPRSRIQHTDVSQGPLQRRYGLATLVVHTAGSESAEVDLPGLRHEIALRIRDHLLPRSADDAV